MNRVALETPARTSARSSAWLSARLGVLVLLFVLVLGQAGCISGIMAQRSVSSKLMKDHPGFTVISLEKLKFGHGDGLGDRYGFIIASKRVPAFKIAGTIRLEGRMDYLDQDILSLASDNPVKLTDKAREAFIDAFVADLPGKTYYPNEATTRVTAMPDTLRAEFASGVAAKGDPEDFFVIQYGPKDRADRLTSDVAVSALYEYDSVTEDWRLIARKAADFLTEQKSERAAQAQGFKTPQELMKAVITAINTDPSTLADYYSPARLTAEVDRSSFAPDEEIRRALLESYRYAKLTFDIVARGEIEIGMDGAELSHRGRIMRDGKTVRVVDIAKYKGLYYVERIGRAKLLPQ